MKAVLSALNNVIKATSAADGENGVEVNGAINGA
jgi:hypothetical protein